MNHSLSGQIEYWAKIVKILKDNPDLSSSFVQKILIGKEETENSELTPYEFKSKEDQSRSTLSFTKKKETS